jgi:hypothetical protein
MNKKIEFSPDERSKVKVLPGIEPGLPEDTEFIRIRSDNRYLGWILAGQLRMWYTKKNVHYKTIGTSCDWLLMIQAVVCNEYIISFSV